MGYPLLKPIFGNPQSPRTSGYRKYASRGSTTDAVMENARAKDLTEPQRPLAIEQHVVVCGRKNESAAPVPAHEFGRTMLPGGTPASLWA
jgi:hypothetical protein